MGCDIHSYAEVKKDGKWEKAKKLFKNPYYNAERKTKVCEDGYIINAEFIGHPYNCRNYELFAFLADVRNYDEIKPLSNPKGLPEGASFEIKKESDYWDTDGHSHSWFTLKELKEADLSQEYNDGRLILNKDVDGNVTGTCRGTTGSHLGEVGRVKLFSVFNNNPVQTIIDNLETIENEDGEAIRDEDIRIVFWFDN